MAVVAVEGLLYADHFWGEKHHGFQVLQENLKRSEETVNEISQFVKERLSIEDEYVKSLNRSVNKVSSFINNNSNIEPIWKLTKGTIELLAEIHLMLVRNLQDLSKDVLKYKDDVVKGRKELKQSNVAEAVNLMQTTTTCLQKTKETYHHRCQELEKVRKESNATSKEIAKIENKVIRARDEYKGYVDKYEQVREDFEEKMIESCKKFQTFDRSLYASIQQYMLLFATHTNEMSQASLQVTEQFRESIQHLNADEFVRKFIKRKSTGCEKPAPVSFEEAENGSPCTNRLDNNDLISANSMPSSCSSSGVLHEPTNQNTNVDILMMDTIGEINDKDDSKKELEMKNSNSCDDSVSSEKKSSFISTGPAAKKISMFMSKRKKTLSTSSIDDSANENHFSSSGIFKFSREKRRSRNIENGIKSMDDTQSTASSSKSDEKVLNTINPLDAPVEKSDPVVDDEGYIIRDETVENRMETTNWSSYSSDEEDENELQQSKIRGLTIRPVDRTTPINASVDELRDAIGSITLTRSSTFERDPWTINGSKAPPPFSQSMNCSSLRQPLRSHHTADGRFRTTTFSESENDNSAPPPFSVSMGYQSGMSALSRARPRSNTPTATQMMSSMMNNRKDSTSSFNDPWSSSLNIGLSESNNSLGESSFNLSQSTGNLMQATISEQRIPIAMAINEYSHVWFKKADLTQCVQRTFGTVMISFASSSIQLLTSVQNDIEPLAFRIENTRQIKAVLPNKMLIDEKQSFKGEDDIYTFYFNKQNLANWLNEQQKTKPNSMFHNAEIARYELDSTAPGNSQPPIYLAAYWKFEPKHTDIRVDYRLNTDCNINNPLINVVFNTTISGNVESCTSDPPAKWNEENKTILWNVLEISRNGDITGSLKTRAFMKTSDNGDVDFDILERKPSQVFVQFQCHETNLSGVSVSLVHSDVYHLSMVRKKIIAGKYFCDPELRK